MEYKIHTVNGEEKLFSIAENIMINLETDTIKLFRGIYGEY